MNQHLQNIINFLNQNNQLTAEEKDSIIQSLKNADKELEIAAFKLDRTEKVKRTTGILLEETIAELEQKRKAVEEQNRELEIEAALERVRTVAMGMSKPDDLLSICDTMFHELQKLSFDDLRNTMINLHDDAKQFILNYDYSELSGKTITKFKYNSHPIVDNLINHAKQSGETFTEMIYSGKTLDELRAFRKENGEEDDPRFDSVDAIYYYFYSIGAGSVGLSTFKKINDEQLVILKRFRNVFDLAYKRYVDFTTAESQAREAKIEAALERVRSRSMAMQHSEELNLLINTVYAELIKLDIVFERCSIMIFDKDGNTTWWMASQDDQAGQNGFFVKNNNNELQVAYLNAWKQRLEKWDYILEGDTKKKWEEYIFSETELSMLPDFIINRMKSIKATHITASFNNFGCLSTGSLEPLTDEAFSILLRFAKVFDLTYTRFNDLKQAESNAKEARIETALERVRSRTLAMQKSDELVETAASLFQQLSLLGIEPNRLYINIMKDDIGNAEFWITDEDGSKITMAYADNLNNNPSFKKMLDGWKLHEKSLIIDMHDDELQEYFHYLSSIHVPFKGGLTQKRRLQYIAYFSQGFIGMASPDEQPAETMQLLERFAYVFNLTYTRFNDLKIAEAHALQAEQDLIEIKAARKKAEDTLTELQAAQKQLIQSEKMASLGELTAGIAHEIQNPLNFVNNFSEVSNELIEELRIKNYELKIEDPEVKELLNDIGQNLEKINHHGQRAADIVKGMLQHSRSSTGQKELTDINALCDEYLRLAYHGMRAKDKSFNAEMKTDFDESIGKIKIVPQDIGRVILNLINNAFYAVNEKKKLSANSYQPLAEIKTRKLNDKVEIIVSDNGNGIPSTIKDKIFQPFFTTKPTGQGTGLGLSLSYDIVKAHGGEIKVETKEGEGTEFVVQLPS